MKRKRKKNKFSIVIVTTGKGRKCGICLGAALSLYTKEYEVLNK